MRKIVLTLAVMLGAFISAPTSYAMQSLRDNVPNAQKVGEGRLTYLMWDIYDASLYAPQGEWKKSAPFAIHLSYLRDITGKKIADRSIVEIRNQGIDDEVTLASWHSQMRNIFPDVDKGVSLTGVYAANGDSVFYQNDKEIGRITDPEFSKAFFNIWLDEKTSSPDLRQKLLGLL